MVQRAVVMSLAFVAGGCCGGAPCGLPSSDVLAIEGYDIVSVTSDCGSPLVTNGVVRLGGLEAPATCHFDARLDDGQKIHLDVVFATKVDVHCCGTITRYTADTQPLVIQAPPGYKPHVDAGLDAADAADAAAD